MAYAEKKSNNVYLIYTLQKSAWIKLQPKPQDSGLFLLKRRKLNLYFCVKIF
jgi:hypothetical protein